MDEVQVKSKSYFARGLKLVLRLLELAFLLVCWFVYAFLTLNRSEQAVTYTGGSPMPGKYSFLLLGLVLVFYLRKSLFVKKWSIGLVVERLLVVLVFVFGVMIYLTSQSL